MLLFEDERIAWFIEELGGVQNQSVLELGPLEAGHTYMLARAGAASVLGIEANPHAYLKCLIIREIMELRQARFLCGDFIKYLQTTEEKFDCLKHFGFSKITVGADDRDRQNGPKITLIALRE